MDKKRIPRSSAQRSATPNPGPTGRRPGQKAGLGAGRNPLHGGQRRRLLARHYRAKFLPGRSGRR